MTPNKNIVIPSFFYEQREEQQDMEESSESDSDVSDDENQENIPQIEEVKDVSEHSQKVQENSQRSQGSEVISQRSQGSEKVSQRSHFAEILNSFQVSEKAPSQAVKSESDDKVDSQRSEGSQRSQHLGVNVMSPRNDLSDHSSGHSPRSVRKLLLFVSIWFDVTLI